MFICTYEYTWRWLLWNCSVCVCVRMLFCVICKTCRVLCAMYVCYIKSLFIIPFCSLASFCTRTNMDSSNTQTHACTPASEQWRKKRELSRMQFYSVCSGVGVHVYGNVYRYDNYECEQFWYDGAMHMTFTRDDGRKYGDPFPLSSAELFTQLKKAMCTVLRQHKQIPLNIKLFLVIWLCETRILSTKIWRSVQSKLKTTFCASFPTIRWISF